MAIYFIYGTLKDNMKNNHILKECRAKFIGDVITKDKYPMFDLGDGFPYIQDKKGIGYNISGELYEIKDSYQKKLDWFEGVPTLYKRGKIEVEGNIGCSTTADCYFIVDELDIDELNRVNFLNEWID